MMVILGLGTNLGDRLANLRQAYQLIQKIPQFNIIQVSPVYISDALLPANAPSEWDRPHLNLALRCETQLTPHELLRHTKKIEQQLKSSDKQHWGPRVIDIDLLAWDDLVIYDDKLHIPHEHLHERPFALWPLTDVAPYWRYPLPGLLQGKTAIELAAQWGSKLTGDAPLHTKQILQRVDTAQWVGIVNLTPDSFSADGFLNHEENAWLHVKHLIDSGAEVLDFGAEATGPHAVSLTAEEEWRRLASLLSKTISEKNSFMISPKISVDTRHAEVAEKALALGVDWINDVSGLDDPSMRAVLRHSECDIVFMHHLGIPVNKNRHIPSDQDPTLVVLDWARVRIDALTREGIALDRLIFDPGIGFGKTAAQSLEIIRNMHLFDELGVRILVGHSRKSFLTQFTREPAAKRDLETVLVSVELVKQSVDYLRVHNVEANARGVRIAKELSEQSPSPAINQKLVRK